MEHRMSKKEAVHIVWKDRSGPFSPPAKRTIIVYCTRLGAAEYSLSNPFALSGCTRVPKWLKHADGEEQLRQQSHLADNVESHVLEETNRKCASTHQFSNIAEPLFSPRTLQIETATSRTPPPKAAGVLYRPPTFQPDTPDLITSIACGPGIHFSDLRTAFPRHFCALSMRKASEKTFYLQHRQLIEEFALEIFPHDEARKLLASVENRILNT